MKTRIIELSILTHLFSSFLFASFGGSLRDNACVQKAIDAGYVNTGGGDKYFSWKWGKIVDSTDSKLDSKCRGEVYILGMQDAEEYAKYLESKGYVQDAEKQRAGLDWVSSTWGGKAFDLCYSESSSIMDVGSQLVSALGELPKAREVEHTECYEDYGDGTFAEKPGCIATALKKKDGIQIDRKKIQNIIESDKIPEKLKLDTARVLNVDALTNAEAKIVLNYFKEQFPQAYLKEGFIVYGSGSAYSNMKNHLDYISGLDDPEKKNTTKKYINDIAQKETLIKGSAYIPEKYTKEQIEGIAAIAVKRDNSIVFFNDKSEDTDDRSVLFHETAHQNYATESKELIDSILDENKKIPSKYLTSGFKDFLLNEYLAYKKGGKLGNYAYSDNEIIGIITKDSIYKNKSSTEDKKNFIELFDNAQQNNKSILQQLIVEINVSNG